MAKPGVIYRIINQCFHETEDIQEYIDISDNSVLIDDGDTPTITVLSGTGAPVTLEVIDNDESPFKVIKALQCRIGFLSTQQVNMSTFIHGADLRWGVHVYIGDTTKTIFKGFLTRNGMTEDFLIYPNQVYMTATDNLGILKDVPMVDFYGDNPTGYNLIIQYLAWCMNKTGLFLEFRVAFNIKLTGLTSDIRTPNTDREHLFDTIYLHARSMEAEIGESEDCYTVIEKILGHESCLFQYQGAWWIVRIDEIENATRGLYVTSFDATGSFIGNLGEFNFDKSIGVNNDIKLLRGTVVSSGERAIKSLRLYHEFEVPEETPCNTNFLRGGLITEVDATESHFELDCWSLLKDVLPPTHPSPATSNTVYIKRIYTGMGDETERYVVITYPPYPDPSRLECEGVIVSAKDKISLSYDYKWSSGINAGTVNVNQCQIRLEGDDGTVWFMDDDGKWYQSDSTWSTNRKIIITSWDSDAVDETDWRTISPEESDPIPVDGQVIVCILWGQTSALASRELHISNFSLGYIPYINGTYQHFTGQQHRTEQTQEYQAKIDEQVWMTDLPRKLFKWAMFYKEGSDYFLANSFYNAAVFPDGGYPDSTYEHTYGELQLFDVWNQYRYTKRLFYAVGQGTDLEKVNDDDLVDSVHLINKYFITDTSEHTYKKLFQLLTFSQNHRTGQWSGTMREVDNTDVAKDYSNHEFKFY